MRLWAAAALILLVVAGLACGDDDSAEGGQPTTVETPAEQWVVAGACPADPQPTGASGTVVPGLLFVGFDSDVTIDEARTFLDTYITDYRIGLNQFARSQVAVVCVGPGEEDAVTRLFPLGTGLKFVQRYRVDSGF